MNIFKKLLSIIVVITLIITSFMPPIIVHAEEEDLPFTVYIYYPESDTDQMKEKVGSYNTYDEARLKVLSLNLDKNVSAGVENDGRVIYADYALVHMDGPRNNRQTGDYVINVYPTNSLNGTKLTYVAGTWGVDAAFLDFDPGHMAVKVKLSGLVGWVSIDKVTIQPIGPYYGRTRLYGDNSPKIHVNSSKCINVRTAPGIESERIPNICAESGRDYIYRPEKTTKKDGYTWYYANINGTYGYVASEDETWIEVKNTLLTDTFYYVHNNDLYHYIHMGRSQSDYALNIGEAPKNNDNNYFLKNSQNTNYLGITNRYLSFDGNYFYTDYKTMIDDYRSGSYQHAINYEYPYYPYFMYVPAHTLTNITKETINNSLINNGITSPLTHEVSYYYNSDGSTNHQLGVESILYNTGELFVNAANTYGISPITIYTAAMRESGYGRSAIALLKNNLFGMGAADDDPFNKAFTYSSIEESINDYANTIGGQSSYTNINHTHYHGTHKGNKGSGTVVYYMSDPYGGEKDSAAAYKLDRESGRTQQDSNTLGIKNSDNLVSIYKSPSKNSGVIYQTKNYYTGFILKDMPFIVVDKVYTYEDGKNQGYYKVYTDVSLNENQDVCPSCTYSFLNSYGYIKEEDLYVKNNQPVINANNIEIKQFETFNPLNGITATDKEDGNLTNITPTGTVDTTKTGNYNITYTVKDKSNFSVSKTVRVTVIPTDAPIINASDIEIPAYKAFDPYKNVTVTDNYYGDITNKLQVIENNVNINKTGIYTVKYKAVNDANVESTKTINVTVIANQKPVINANNITKYLDDSFDPLEGVSATDKEDGVLTNITYTGTVDTSTVGEYQITYKVKDLDNQETTKTITVSIEEREYIKKENVFYLDKLLYNENTKKVDFQGFLILKEIDNTLDKNINYSIIFENQYSKEKIIKTLSRLTENIPFTAPVIDGKVNTGAWFTSSLDVTDIPTGNYTVYVRARYDKYEGVAVLNNSYFNTNVSKKFSIDNKGYQFRTNYFSRKLPLEFIVRQNGLISSTNNPTIDNMYNQLYSMELDGTKLKITASSHNVGGDYSVNSNVERYISLENIQTNENFLRKEIGSITDGPYKISLRVDDGYDKTRAWYRTEIDLKDLQKGTYSIILRTKTNNIDDYGELYDIINSNLELSSNSNGKKISIRVNKEIRYRIEVTIE